MQLYELIQDFFPAPSMIGYGKKVRFPDSLPDLPHIPHFLHFLHTYGSY